MILEGLGRSNSVERLPRYKTNKGLNYIIGVEGQNRIWCSQSQGAKESASHHFHRKSQKIINYRTCGHSASGFAQSEAERCEALSFPKPSGCNNMLKWFWKISEVITNQSWTTLKEIMFSSKVQLCNGSSRVINELKRIHRINKRQMPQLFLVLSFDFRVRTFRHRCRQIA